MNENEFNDWLNENEMIEGQSKETRREHKKLLSMWCVIVGCLCSTKYDFLYFLVYSTLLSRPCMFDVGGHARPRK